MIEKKIANNYSEVLKELGFSVRFQYPWAKVGETKRIQGWKLHLSSIITEATALLKVIAKYFQDNDVCFKVTCNSFVLSQLNEGQLGTTQIGKFITIYPSSDDHAKRLVEKLVKITKGFHGPVIVTDVRLGDIVYARYGGFNPIIKRDRLGQSFLMIYGEDGELYPDSYTSPFKPPFQISDPFNKLEKISKDPTSLLKNGKLFGPGYLLVDALKRNAKGSVFRAIDLRDQSKVSIKVIKEGKQFCLSDEYDRDMRTRLQHQELLNNALCDKIPIPKADPYFEVNGDGYLPLDYIEGQSLESLAKHSWSERTLKEKKLLLSYLKQLLIAIDRLHSLGYVHRDLSPTNIHISRDGRVYLLDLELSQNLRDPDASFGLGTHSYMSPQQEARSRPTVEDDIYTLGCLMIRLFTSFQPRTILFGGKKNRNRHLSALIKNAPPELIKIISDCVEQNPKNRPSVKRIIATIQQYANFLDKFDSSPASCIKPHNNGRKDWFSAKIARKVLEGGQQGLLNAVIMQNGTNLWLSPVISGHATEEMNIVSHYEVHRSMNRGISGVVYVLSRLARFGYANIVAKKRVKEAVRWLLSGNPSPDSELPGLHFGEAGVAVAIAEAISARLINPDAKINSYLFEALSKELNWPDITHGAAGQGLATLYCADRLQDSKLQNLSHRCADFLIKSQNDDGSWTPPSGVDGMSGKIFTGFAHGVSGIIYFLAEYSHRFNNLYAQKSWQAGANWMIKQAHASDNYRSLEWDFSTDDNSRWKWWCNGSPGIALTFLSLFEKTKEKRYAEIAKKALHVHPFDVRYSNLSQCHGLSGLGEIYLEAYRVLNNEQWYNRAWQIANVLFYLRREEKTGSITWLVEDPYHATADLMIGSGGIVHFFLRFFSDKIISYPLLIDPTR